MKIKSATSIKGKRDYMEDSASFVVGSKSIITVCDGHGGDSLSKKTVKELPHLLMKIDSKSPLENAIDIQTIIINYGDSVYRTKAGTTLTGAIEYGDYIYVFNVGDSRTSIHMKEPTTVNYIKPVFNEEGEFSESKHFIFETTFFTTIDHDSTLLDEQNRIKNAGGVLVGDRLNGILNVTRTLGDNGVGPGLNHTPDVYWINKKDIIAIVVYTDGVYQNMPNHRDIQQKHLLYHIAEKYGSEMLIKYAFNNNRSEDNITVVVLG
jgi:serine/threonine protein phosphatase PrpC